MLWKIYFWVYLVLSIIGLFSLLPQLSLFNFASWEGLAESVLLVIGTYAFVYNKSIFPNAAWKVIFSLISLVWIAQLIYYSNAVPSIKPFFSFLANNPPQSYGMVAVYKLAFTKK